MIIATAAQAAATQTTARWLNSPEQVYAGALISVFAVLILAVLFQSDLKPDDSASVPRWVRETFRHVDAFFKPVAVVTALFGGYLCGYSLMHRVSNLGDLRVGSAVAALLVVALLLGTWLSRFINNAWLSGAEPHLAPVWRSAQALWEAAYAVVALILLAGIFSAVVASRPLDPVLVAIVASVVVLAGAKGLTNWDERSTRAIAERRDASLTGSEWKPVSVTFRIGSLVVPCEFRYLRDRELWAIDVEEVSVLRRNIRATAGFLDDRMAYPKRLICPKVKLFRRRVQLVVRLKVTGHRVVESPAADLLEYEDVDMPEGLYGLGTLKCRSSLIHWWAAADPEFGVALQRKVASAARVEGDTGVGTSRLSHAVGLLWRVRKGPHPLRVSASS
jgi:hypothetical protein